jgi:hypothetical protein
MSGGRDDGGSEDVRRGHEAPDALAQALLAQLDELWNVELGDMPMAVDFDPARAR